MIRRLYDWTMDLAATRRAMWALALVAFAESSFFPVPPDALMIPMILAAPRRAFLIAAVCMAASVLGGLAGYAIGALAYAYPGQPVLEFLGLTDDVEWFNARFNEAGFWAVLVAGLTPVPYKVVTVLSGWTGLPLATFAAMSVLSRGARFFVEAALLRRFGSPIRDFVERRLGLMFALGVLILAAGFAMTRYL